jgi:hypothetical protein
MGTCDPRRRVREGEGNRKREGRRRRKEVEKNE